MTRLFVLAAALAAPSDPPPDESEPSGSDASSPVVTKTPELTTFVEAEYPESARAEGRVGTVGLVFTIQADGTVTDIEVSSSAGADLDAAAVAAVTQFVFSPALIDDEPGAVRIRYDYAFTLETKVEEVPIPEPEIPSGVLRGQLLERGTRAPLPGMEIRLPALGSEAFTDAEGRFEFEAVPAGTVTIIVRDPLYAELEDEETVMTGQATEVTYYLERTGFEDGITVVGRRPKKQVVRRTLTIQEIRTIPGTQGDALKVIQNLPGVARQVISDEIVLRGGGRSQAFVDQHPIPLAFHFGGLRSTVSSGLIENIDLYPGNFGAEYGRLNGGIIEIGLRSPRTDGYHGFIEADFFDAGFLLEGPIDEHWSFAVAGRRSYIDQLLPLVLDAEILGNFNTAPRYYDGQVLVEGKYGRHTVRALGLFSSDLLEILFPRGDESDTGVRFGQDWEGARLEWTFRPDERVRNELSVSYLQQESGFGVDFGGGPSVGLDVIERRLTLRDTLNLELADWAKLRVGTDSELLLANYSGRVPAPPREGEPSANGKPNEDIFREFDADLDALSPSLWSDVELEFGAVTLLPGVRVDYFGGTEDFEAQPRLAVRYKLQPATTLKGAVGLYAEPPSPDETSDEFGNPDIGPERSVHYSLGFERRLTDALSVDLIGFYKTLDDLITSVDDPSVQVRNQGQGRAFGLELLIRHDLTERFFGWIAYTLMRSEREDEPGADTRPFDLDQTHNLIVVGQYKITPTWVVGLRFRYVTGNPTTPVTSADFDADEGTFVPVYGAVNSDRLPAFHQLDLRVDKNWVFDTWKLTAYLDVQNVYNRENPEGIEYSFDYRESVTQAGLPIIPSLGLRGEF